MTSSLTIAFSGTSPVLEANFLPEIELDVTSSYSCALLDLFIHECSGVNELKKLDVINIKCDIIGVNSYINGAQSRIIHQFATCTSHTSAQTFVEIPKHINYIPINTKNLRSIQISIVDSKGELIDISGGNIICRINIKRDNIEKSV